MIDLRRLNDLRTRARTSFYCCQRTVALVADPRLRELLGRAAGARWRLVQSIDAFLVSQPAAPRSRLELTWHDRGACLSQRLRAALATHRDLHGLRWLVQDSTRLRHAVEICRGLSWSLEVSDFLSASLVELRQVQRSTHGLVPSARSGNRTPVESRTPFAAA